MESNKGEQSTTNIFRETCSLLNSIIRYVFCKYRMVCAEIPWQRANV